VFSKNLEDRRAQLGLVYFGRLPRRVTHQKLKSPLFAETGASVAEQPWSAQERTPAVGASLKFKFKPPLWRCFPSFLRV
jgi:hypothetical protein